MEDSYIKRVLNGDQEAFTYLVIQNQALAMRTAMAIVKNEAVAKDMVQSSFLQAYLGLSGFKQNAKFSTWLCRIVINNCLQFSKRTALNREKARGWNEAVTYAQNKGWTQLDKEDLEQFVKNGLKSLSSKEALCLQLYYLEEYNLDEIFQLTGFSKANIKVLLHRGRKNLYQYITKTK